MDSVPKQGIVTVFVLIYKNTRSSKDLKLVRATKVTFCKHQEHVYNYYLIHFQDRSSRSRMFFKIRVLKIFAIFPPALPVSPALFFLL